MVELYPESCIVVASYIGRVSFGRDVNVLENLCFQIIGMVVTISVPLAVSRH